MKFDKKTLLITVGIAALLSVPMAFGLTWLIQTVDSHTFACPTGVSMCTLYPLGQGNGYPSFNLASGQSVTSMLVSRMIVYPTTTTSETTPPS